MGEQPEFDFEQREHLRRVSSEIAMTVLDFLRERTFFHADDLRRFVASRHPTAPASADRILRDLRQRGRIGYRVLNRRESLYQVEFVKEGA